MVNGDEIRQPELPPDVSPEALLGDSVAATASGAIERILEKLPIVGEEQYMFDRADPAKGWKEGSLHWYPVGGERGNSGRIKLASKPTNPIAERTINAMEAVIELERQYEILVDPNNAAPANPRDAVSRYFQLPPLDQLPKMDGSIQGKKPREHAREIARRIRVQLQFDKKTHEFTVTIEDDGIGQSPSRMHETLLSLGSSDKPDKPYLIGVFGQGGSSAYHGSQYSCVVSRRAPRLLGEDSDGVGWTVVKHVFPKGRRDDYFAYLAARPDGRVLALPPTAAEAIGLKHGSRFVHVHYNFGPRGSAITRTFYQTLNHTLFNPVLPFDLNVSGTQATVYGNGYRLSNMKVEQKDLDKTFGPQLVRG